MADAMRVINPANLPAQIPCECHRLMPDARLGYKPNVVRLSTGELVLANFHTHHEVYGDGSMCEHIVLHRSADEGRTWISQHHDHLWGREPYLNLFSGDVLIITTHFLDSDVRNQTGHTTVYLHRSVDGGATWTSAHVDVDMIPDEVPYTYTSRNVIELSDGTYVLGVGSGHGRDYLFTSGDQGVSWQVRATTVEGFDNAAYEYSVLQEGIFFCTDSGRLLLFARCDLRRMSQVDPIPGLPDMSSVGDSDSDHFDVEIVFESRDGGGSWQPVNGFPILGCMYPSVCGLGGDRYLFTYTQRVPLAGRHMGVYAFIMREESEGAFAADVDRDLIVIDEKTPDCYDSGGGFGNTIMLQDGSLLTPYSFLDADPEIHELMRTGAFMEQATFDLYRNRALPYYRRWVEHITWERVRAADPIAQRHAFLGCTNVLNLSGHITEVCRWRLDL